jgi:hypothetical protein
MPRAARLEEVFVFDLVFGCLSLLLFASAALLERLRLGASPARAVEPIAPRAAAGRS